MASFGVMTLSFLFLITFGWSFEQPLLGWMWVASGLVGLFIAICELIGSPNFGLGDFLGRLFIVGVLVFPGFVMLNPGGPPGTNAKTGDKVSMAQASNDLYNYAVEFRQVTSRYKGQIAEDIRNDPVLKDAAFKFAYYFLDFRADFSGTSYWFYDDPDADEKEMKIDHAITLVIDIYGQEYLDWKFKNYGTQRYHGRHDSWSVGKGVDPSEIGYIAPARLSERDKLVYKALEEWVYGNGPWTKTAKEWAEEHSHWLENWLKENSH